MTLEFESRPCNESFARVSAAAFLAQLNPTVEEVADVKTAISEAVTNAMIHGYRQEKGKIQMKCVLDLEEKKENFSSQVVSANFFTTEDVRIYAEPAELVEIGDIRRNGDQNVLFSLTGKKAGSGNLYVASADGSVVSEPVAFTVRTAEEKEQAERPVYYTAIGEYWHFSEECAREDYPDVTYDWKGNSREVDRSLIHVLKVPQMGVVGNKTACPKCASDT